MVVKWFVGASGIEPNSPIAVHGTLLCTHCTHAIGCCETHSAPSFANNPSTLFLVYTYRLRYGSLPITPLIVLRPSLYYLSAYSQPAFMLRRDTFYSPIYLFFLLRPIAPTKAVHCVMLVFLKWHFKTLSKTFLFRLQFQCLYSRFGYKSQAKYCTF